MKNLRTTIKPLTAAVASAIVVTALSSNVTAAITEENAKRIKQDYPLKSLTVGVNTMEDWLVNTASTYALNPINLRGGFHPDREDPDEKGGDYDVVYIFPDAATANAWWDPTVTDTPPIEIPDDAVAFIHWELDNGSGSFPGIMSKSDIDGFKSRNCIMAAGDLIPVQGVGEVEKTCSNPQGASKRFKMQVLKHDTPIDLVYNVETAPLTYTNYDTLPTFDAVEESGRVYRILQKFHNATGTDSATEARTGERMSGFSLTLGYGVGSGFSQITDGANDGLEPDKALGWELRPCMPDHFLDIFRDRPGTGTNPCSSSYDNNVTDYPDLGQPLPQEIWLEEEYASFSPKMYSTIDDKRMLGIGIPGGFFDKNPSGNYPPAIQTMGYLDSGTFPSDDPVYWDSRVDGATALPGYVGPTVPNYFDLVANQFTLNGITTVLPPEPYPFGYLMWYGVLADDDVGLLMQGIYVDEDGDPGTEGDLLAWWDGAQYRWSIDGPVFDGIIDPDTAYAPVDQALIDSWSLYPLVEDADFTTYPETGFPTPPVYEVGVNDDLGGMNIDSFVYLGRNYDAATNPTFTVRLQTNSMTASGVAVDAYGNRTPAWVASPAPELIDNIGIDGIIDIKDEPQVGNPLVIVLGDEDAGIVTPGTETVPVTNLTTGETETVILTVNPDLSWKFEASLPTVASPDAGVDNDGVLNTWVGQEVQVVYTDVSNTTGTAVDRIDTETMLPPDLVENCTDGIDNDGDGLIDFADPDCPLFEEICGDGIDNDGDGLIDEDCDVAVDPSTLSTEDGGFCSYNPNGRFDPVLPALLLIGLGYLGLRRKVESGK